jgi:hypothetical protein
MLFNFIALGYLNSDPGGFWIETDLIIYQVAISMFRGALTSSFIE